MRLAILLLIGCTVVSGIHAQDEPPRMVKIKTDEGRMFFGELMKNDAHEVIIMTENLGEVAIEKMRIVSIENSSEAERIQEESFNPQPSRYFFAPSAFQMKKGEGYYQNTMLVYNQLSFGISDHITVGLPFLLPFYGGVTVKAGTPLTPMDEQGKALHASTGLIYVTPITGGQLDRGVGLSFVNLSFGSESRHFTAGVGRFFQTIFTSIEEDGTFIGNAIFNIAGMAKVGNNMWLMTENYFLFEDNGAATGFVAVGFRKGRSRAKGTMLGTLWDFGILSFVNGGQLAGLTPTVGLTLPFSTKRMDSNVSY